MFQRKYAGSLLALLITVVFYGVSQTPAKMTPTLKLQVAGGGNQDITGQNQPVLDPELQHKQEKARAEEREKKLKQNAMQLLKLAQELKVAVDKTNEHVLSLEVVDKADQIGKLAKKIKDSMRDAN